MKKIFITLVFTFCLCPLGFAQFVTNLPGPEVLSYYMSQIFVNPTYPEGPFFTERAVNHDYQTVEEHRLFMSPKEYKEFYAKEPVLNKPETQTTNKYKNAIIRIPPNYNTFDVFVNIDKETGEASLVLANDLISIESDMGDISFKLDYKIYPAAKVHQKELQEQGLNYDINKRPLRLEVNYDPKYFTLKKVNNYNPNKKVSVEYEGKVITLNTVTQPLLYIEDKNGNDTEFVLEPNFQNLYKDFKFVREGHKEVKFRDL